MYSSYIGEKFVDASAEVKYFFIKLLYHHTKANDTEVGVKSLAKQFGLTERTVYEGIQYFQNIGYLARATAITGGRPALRVRLTDQVQFLHEKRRSCKSAHFNVLEKILENDSCDNAIHALSVAGKLLLIVLLHHSDQFGVIRDLGLAQLEQLTGMKRGRLNSQLEVLETKRLILRRVSGVNGDYLFGKKKGVIFVKIEYPWLRASRSRRGIILGEFDYFILYIFEFAAMLGDINVNEGEIAVQVAIYRRGPDFRFQGGFISVYQFFERCSLSEQRFFVVKLEEYIAYLLTNHFSQVQLDAAFVSQALLEKIALDLYCPKYFLKSRNEIDQSGRAIAMLADYVYALAWEMARKYAHDLSCSKFQIDKLKAEGLAFCFLPFLGDGERLLAFQPVADVV